MDKVKFIEKEVNIENRFEEELECSLNEHIQL